MSGKKIAVILLAGLLVFGIGGVVGYKGAELQDTSGEPLPTDPGKEQQPEPNKPEPTPAEPQQPTETPDTNPPEPTTPTTPPAQTSDVISVRAFHGSGSLPLQDKKLKNNAFDIERIDWSEANQTIVIVGKMRVFEAVGYVRVRDENKAIIEPERVIRAAEGAPAWSRVEAQIPLVAEYKGKTLIVEFYEKSANDGSRTNMLSLKIKPE